MSDDDLFESAAEIIQFGPIFTAEREGDCAACPEYIIPGEDIRADGKGGWIHHDEMCERVARQ